MLLAHIAGSFAQQPCNLVLVPESSNQCLWNNDYSSMMADETDFCFHLVCCHNDKLCIVDVCIPHYVIGELCLGLQNKSYHPAYSESGNADIASAEKAFILAPNPATGTVRVLEMQDDRGSDEITRIEVYSLLG